MHIQVDFWNVGQGDSSSLLFSDGSLVVIDVGPPGNSFVQWMVENPRHIDCLALTHNDMDHIGGLDQLYDAGISVAQAFSLLDRPKKNLKESFSKLNQMSKGRLFRLEVGNTPKPPIFLRDDFALEVRCPSYTMNFQKERNFTSAILVLTFQGRDLITWGGDQKLEVVAEKTTETQMLFGPHHGAPQDNRTHFAKHLSTISPSYCFVSVGSKNIYQHPKEEYIKALAERGCIIQCSQLTCKCSSMQSHILQGEAYYGLPAPKTGISCHGHLRFNIDETGNFLPDELYQIHRDRVCAAGFVPLCMVASEMT